MKQAGRQAVAARQAGQVWAAWASHTQAWTRCSADSAAEKAEEAGADTISRLVNCAHSKGVREDMLLALDHTEDIRS